MRLSSSWQRFGVHGQSEQGYVTMDDAKLNTHIRDLTITCSNSSRWHSGRCCCFRARTRSIIGDQRCISSWTSKCALNNVGGANLSLAAKSAVFNSLSAFSDGSCSSIWTFTKKIDELGLVDCPQSGPGPVQPLFADPGPGP